MRIRLRDDEHHLTLDIERDGDSFRVNHDSTDYLVRAELLNEQSLVVSIDGRRHRVVFVRQGDTLLLAIAGEIYALSREQSRGADSSIEAVTSPEIVAPMPGKVIQVLVKPGDLVAAGDTILVLEAMKMENRLLAEAPGVVGTINVSPGDLVEGGQVLAVIDYPEPGGSS